MERYIISKMGSGIGGPDTYPASCMTPAPVN